MSLKTRFTCYIAECLQLDKLLQMTDAADENERLLRPVVVAQYSRERENSFATKKTYKIILNISTVAGYQIGKPIKLVAYSTNYIKS